MRNFLFILLSIIALNADVLIEVKGQGNSIKEAKADALRQISEQIVVSITSEYNKKESVSSNIYKKNISTQLNAKSSLILKGIEYLVDTKVGSLYEIKARFTSKSYKNSVDYLYSLIDIDLSLLSRHKIEKLLVYTLYLKAINTLVSYDLVLRDNIKAKEDEIYRYLNLSRVSFVIKPKDANIEIDTQLIHSNETKFFKSGSHSYVVSKKGYLTERATFSSYKGEHKVIKLSLLPDRLKKYNFSISAQPNLKSTANAIIMDYNLSKYTKNNIMIEILEKISKHKMDSVVIAKVTLNYNALLDGKSIKSVKAKYKINGFMENINHKIEEKSQKITKLAIKKLLQKIASR